MRSPFKDMPTRLPFNTLLVPVRMVAARLSPSKLARYSAAVLLLPLKPTRGDWAALPHGPVLRDLYGRKVRKEGDSFQLRVGERAETLLLIACIPSRASIFERLQTAGKLARIVMECEPRSLLMWQQGCAQEAADAALNAAIAALEAAAFRFATFKSKPKPRSSLARIDLAASKKLPELDLTLASAAGNNIARWLTALPPNTLDAAAYRRLLQDLARRLGLAYKFYGEKQLRRLGAGAFLAVSRGNGTRDAGIVHLSYRPRGAARAGAGPRRQGHVLRHRRHQLEAAQGHARHAHRYGGQRGGARQPVRSARVALAGRGGLLVGHHRKPHRPACLQAARRGARAQWHDHSGDPHRCRRAHGAGGRTLARGAQQSARHHRLRHTDRRLRVCAHRALQRRVHQPSRRRASSSRPRARAAASASGAFPWTRTTTRTWKAPSPT